MGNQSSSEEDDYGGGYHHPSQQPPGGGDGDSDEEPKPIYRPSEDRLQFNLRLKPKFSDLMTLKTVAGDEVTISWWLFQFALVCAQTLCYLWNSTTYNCVP
ncbi:hypothetical protein GBAR_LOCUS22761, partial [Geodia barretti]